MIQSTERRIEPRLPSGFRDLSPEEAAAQKRMIETVCKVYESHGFVPLDTSCVEYYQILVSGHGEGGEKQIYRLCRDEMPTPESALALRFELTASLARYLAHNIDRLPMPFKRYQSGYVWRGERPQRGRFRQFLQFDVDTVGISDPVADAEIVEVIYRSLDALGVPGFEIRISSRSLLAGVARVLGLGAPEAQLEFFRVLDKHDKIGTEKLLALIGAPPSEGGLGLAAGKIELVERILTISGTSDRVMEEASRLLHGPDETARGLREISSILEYLSSAALPHPDYVRVMPSLARGLDYYTGPVFETVVIGQEGFGSVMGGGRYDGLIGHFLGRSIPATGVSMGVDRLLVVLQTLQAFPASGSVCRVVVAVLNPEERPRMYGLASLLRCAGIPSELYMGEGFSFRHQIAYAAQREIPYLLIQGEDERARGIVALRDLRTRTQQELTLEEAVVHLRAQ
ncbi:histidine--tRNA ligase [Candidatus Fermentibacteria bacterium]|nr:histidine--tRNA ligase [Candidatus Fermentibacteria bacterium]